MIVDFDPKGRKDGVVAHVEAFLQKVSDVNPPVVLLTGDGQLVGQLPGPQVTEGDRASQAEEQERPGLAGDDELDQKEDSHKAQ